ncbi:hypothetical protein KP509_34G017800 [Ceratopteris richardii]|nr:hypothetical protein KP509_34G017800 [Ceratopteris richardii]
MHFLIKCALRCAIARSSETEFRRQSASRILAQEKRSPVIELALLPVFVFHKSQYMSSSAQPSVSSYNSSLTSQSKTAAFSSLSSTWTSALDPAATFALTSSSSSASFSPPSSASVKACADESQSTTMSHPAPPLFREDSGCPICISSFKDGQKIRVLPMCGHGFHLSCVDAWLSSHPSCPTCRLDLSDFFANPPLNHAATYPTINLGNPIHRLFTMNSNPRRNHSIALELGLASSQLSNFMRTQFSNHPSTNPNPISPETSNGIHINLLCPQT